MRHELYFFSKLRYLNLCIMQESFQFHSAEKMLHCKIDGKDLAGSKLKCRLKCDVNWIQLRVRRALKCLEPLTRIGNDFTHPNLGRIKESLSSNSVLKFGKAAVLICGWNGKISIVYGHYFEDIFMAIFILLGKDLEMQNWPIG